MVLVLGFKALFFWSVSLLNLIANTSLEKKIYKALETFVLNRRLRVVKIIFQKAKEFKLSIFLDKIDGKLTVDECADLSREIKSLLEIENCIESPFILEISSAGIDRYLSSLDDFITYRNYNVRIKSENKIRRGKLISSGPDSLTLSNKDGVKDISLSSILDVKLDLQGMSLKTIKEMEFK